MFHRRRQHRLRQRHPHRRQKRHRHRPSRRAIRLRNRTTVTVFATPHLILSQARRRGGSAELDVMARRVRITAKLPARKATPVALPISTTMGQTAAVVLLRHVSMVKRLMSPLVNVHPPRQRPCHHQQAVAESLCITTLARIIIGSGTFLLTAGTRGGQQVQSNTRDVGN